MSNSYSKMWPPGFNALLQHIPNTGTPNKITRLTSNVFDVSTETGNQQKGRLSISSAIATGTKINAVGVCPRAAAGIGTSAVFTLSMSILVAVDLDIFKHLHTYFFNATRVA